MERYIDSYNYLLPAKRKLVEEHGNRVQFYLTGTGEPFKWIGDWHIKPAI